MDFFLYKLTPIHQQNIFASLKHRFFHRKDPVKVFASFEDAYDYADIVDDEKKQIIKIYQATIYQEYIDECEKQPRYKTLFSHVKFKNPNLNPNYREIKRSRIKERVLIDNLIFQSIP